MAERRKTIVYQSEDGQVNLTVVRAGGVVGMERTLLQIRGAQDAVGKPEAVMVLETISYPDLIAPTVEAGGHILAVDGSKTIEFSNWPLPFEDFALLPDEFIIQWESAVYTVNPHWNPAGTPAAEQEKKAEI